MPKTMAVVFPSRNQVAFAPVDVPAMGPGDVLVRTTWSWISTGTEGSFLRGERVNGETPWRPGDPEPFPIVAGYQRVGVVEEVGAGVTGFKPGDSVFVTISRCSGLYDAFGGHFLLAPAPADQVWHLPAGLDPRAASGLVLTQVGWNCGQRPTINPGDAAVVVGDGLVGNWAAQTLQQRGAKVAVVGRHEFRLGRFAARPADLRVNAKQVDPVEAIKAWAPEGLQAVVDTVFNLGTTMSLFWLLRQQGHLVSAGFLGEDSQIDVQKLRFREATLHAPSGWSRERMDTVLDWVATGRLQTLPLLTHSFPVQDAAEAWATLVRDRAMALGVLLDWRNA